MSFLSHFPSDAPIAVYDSGVGGLAITQALKKQLPQECIHYIGDTQNLPYGEKTTSELLSYVTKVVKFCLNKRYKLLVIACNTATAAADRFLPSYLKKTDQNIAIVNVIDPVVKHMFAVGTYKNKNIGLIGTKHTVADGIYAARFQTAHITLTTLATPLLATMIEDSFCGEKIDNALLHGYLSQLSCVNIDALIPACTHYIFLKDEIKSFFLAQCQKVIEIIDVAQLTALSVKKFLTTRNLLNNTSIKLPDCFMATKCIPAFEHATQKLFGQQPILIDLDASIPIEPFYVKNVMG